MLLSQDPGGGKEDKRGWDQPHFLRGLFSLQRMLSASFSTKRCFETVEKSKLLGVWTVGVSGTQTVHKYILVKLNCSVFTDFFFL